LSDRGLAWRLCRKASQGAGRRRAYRRCVRNVSACSTRGALSVLKTPTRRGRARRQLAVATGCSVEATDLRALAVLSLTSTPFRAGVSPVAVRPRALSRGWCAEFHLTAPATVMQDASSVRPAAVAEDKLNVEDCARRARLLSAEIRFPTRASSGTTAARALLKRGSVRPHGYSCGFRQFQCNCLCG
jgi:hypothetical protein